MRLRLLLCALVYLIALHVSYLTLIAPYFGYHGLDYNPASTAIVVWAWIISLLPVLWLSVTLTRPSLVVYYFIYAFVFVPGCMVPAYTGQLQTPELLRLQLALLACFALLGFIYQIPTGQLLRAPLSRSWFFGSIALFSFATYATIVFYFGIHFRFPDPTNPYDARSDFADASELINSLWVDYCIHWQGLVINPFLMAYGVIAKKYRWVVVAFTGELVIYSLGGLKQVLFGIGLIVGLYLVMKFRNFGPALLTGLALFVLVCLISDKFIFHTTLGMTSFFTRRLVFLPGQLTGLYFDFFSNNHYALLSQSILRGFVGTIYSLPLPNLIGAAYFGSDKMHANGNIWADGYANFGYFGMLAATLILGAVLWLVDSIGEHRNTLLIVLTLGVPAFEFSNSAALTVIANHGVGILVLLLFLTPRDLLVNEHQPMDLHEAQPLQSAINNVMDSRIEHSPRPWEYYR